MDKTRSTATKQGLVGRNCGSKWHTPDEQGACGVHPGYPDGVVFETRAVLEQEGAALVSKIAHDQAGIGVRVRVVGNRLGLQSSKPGDDHGNAKGARLVRPSCRSPSMPFGVWIPI
jgi:hypothetical protein